MNCPGTWRHLTAPSSLGLLHVVDALSRFMFAVVKQGNISTKLQICALFPYRNIM